MADSQNTVTRWNEEHQRYYVLEHTGSEWKFSKWLDKRHDRPDGHIAESIPSSSNPYSTIQSTYHATRPSYPTTRPSYPTTRPSYPTTSLFHSPIQPTESQTREIEGRPIVGTYGQTNPRHYELLDPSYYVRSASFFEVGRVFAVLFIESAGANSNATATDYNTSFSYVKFGEVAYSQVRRFVVVRQKREFCFACPIFTYGNQGTLKPGVAPEEHAIAYTQGHEPVLLKGEMVLPKDPIAIVPPQDGRPLSIASRIYFGIHHPIQYNVKVKDLGCVHPDCIPRLVGYWSMESIGLGGETHMNLAEERTQITDEIHRRPALLPMGPPTTSHRPLEKDDKRNLETEHQAEVVSKAPRSLVPRREVISPSEKDDQKLLETEPQAAEVYKVLGPLDSRYEAISNPRGFFKKGRVFMLLWAEPRGFTESQKHEDAINEQAFVQIARFAVVRAKATHCLCLMISTYSGQATTKPGVMAQDHAAVIPVNGKFVSHPAGENLTKRPIEVKVESEGVTIDPMARINFAKIYTVEYNVKVRNVGRVFGDSIGLLDEYFAASLNLSKLTGPTNA